MKRLSLFAWLLAPLGMIVLVWLFLLPPETEPARTVDTVGVVILDPVDPEDIRNNASAYPLLNRMIGEGLMGSVSPNGATSMDDATLEICTGKNSRKLRYGPETFNRETYDKISRDIRDLDLMVLRRIVRDARRPVRIVTVNGNGTVDDRYLPPDSRRADLILVRIMNNGDDPSGYPARIDAVLTPLIPEASPWLVISPMTRIPVTGYWDVHRWLEEHAYLNRAEDGTVDMAQTRVFYAGGNEPGLRINRVLTYARGFVPRIDYEGLRKRIATELRTVPVPGDTQDPPSPLFRRLYPGENIYTARAEGQYPDIVWELSDPSIAVMEEPDDIPSHRVVPGGWMLLYGHPFDEKLQDQTRLEDLLAADVTPTVLYLLRLPVARDMDGRVLRPLMTMTQHRSMPDYIDSYSLNDPLVDQGEMFNSDETR